MTSLTQRMSALALAVALLAGCGSGTGSPTVSDTTSGLQPPSFEVWQQTGSIIERENLLGYRSLVGYDVDAAIEAAEAAGWTTRIEVLDLAIQRPLGSEARYDRLGFHVMDGFVVRVLNH